MRDVLEQTTPALLAHQGADPLGRDDADPYLPQLEPQRPPAEAHE